MFPTPVSNLWYMVWAVCNSGINNGNSLTDFSVSSDFSWQTPVACFRFRIVKLSIVTEIMDKDCNLFIEMWGLLILIEVFKSKLLGILNTTLLKKINEYYDCLRYSKNCWFISKFNQTFEYSFNSTSNFVFSGLRISGVGQEAYINCRHRYFTKPTRVNDR